MKLPRRFSIAGLMTIVLIISLALAALRSESATWAGGVYLLTYAALLLGIVGAVCRKGAERAWWIGFALFGIAYFRLYFGFGFVFGLRSVTLPTTELLNLMRPAGAKPDSNQFGPLGYYWVVGHCLWSLLAATIGGALALALFAVPEVQSAPLEVEHGPIVPPARAKWRAVVVIGLAFLIPISALILVSPVSSPGLWAGVFYLSTWVVLGVAVLGFACGRGKRRMIWFGAALFGLGYMYLNLGLDPFESNGYPHAVAEEFLEALRPMLPETVSGFPAKTVGIANENARVRKILDRKIPMPFRVDTSLEDVLKYIRAKTKETDGHELPIYVDPIALQDADKTLQDTIRIDLENCPLNTTLRLALRQLSLHFQVRDGMVYIDSYQSGGISPEIDHYLLVGHCFLAMLSAGLGVFLVPLVSNRAG